MNIDNLEIKPMSAEHISDLVEIENASFSKPWTYSGFESELTNDTANFYVAVFNGKVVGYIGFHTVLDEGYVANIAVLPEYRRNGIASVLLQSALEICKQKRLAFLSLEVRKSNENAISLYRKFGFEVVGERKNFYTAPTENAYIMTRLF